MSNFKTLWSTELDLSQFPYFVLHTWRRSLFWSRIIRRVHSRHDEIWGLRMFYEMRFQVPLWSEHFRAGDAFIAWISPHATSPTTSPTAQPVVMRVGEKVRRRGGGRGPQIVRVVLIVMVVESMVWNFATVRVRVGVFRRGDGHEGGRPCKFMQKNVKSILICVLFISYHFELLVPKWIPGREERRQILRHWNLIGYDSCCRYHRCAMFFRRSHLYAKI